MLDNPSEKTFPEIAEWVVKGHPGSDTDTIAAIALCLVGACVGWTTLIKDPMTYYNFQQVIFHPDAQSERVVKRPPEYSLQYH